MAIPNQKPDYGFLYLTRYTAIVEACVNRVRRCMKEGARYVRTSDVADWIASDLPETYKATFQKLEARPVRAYRVRRLLGDARFLGAGDELGLRAVPGRGLTLEDRVSTLEREIRRDRRKKRVARASLRRVK